MKMMSMASEWTWWLSNPVTFHGSRAFDCGDKTPLQCQWYQQHWHFWYIADLVFGRDTVYFCCAMIGLFLLGRVVYRLAPASLRTSKPYRSGLAGFRFLSYRSYRIRALGWYSPSVGVLFLGAVGFIFFFSMMLGPKPYYWPTYMFGAPADYGDSPPIATRSGWMALGLFPFVIVLPMKLNLISVVTGVSHERLQVFHRWSAVFMLILALVHTFPFIIHSIAVGAMEENWKTNLMYKSGVAAIVPQAYLTLFSWGPIRNRFYEVFKFTHILAAVLFSLFFFIHCNYTLTSWDYFVVAGTLYFGPYFLSLIRTYAQYTPFTKAEISMAAPNLLCINVPVKQGADWKLGQHMFLRFVSPSLHFHCITAHPFTICSEPNDGTPTTLTFYVKPHSGITGRLAALAKQAPGRKLSVLLDGPYGGMHETRLSTFDRVWIIAGGSGGGFTLPVIADCLRRQQEHQSTPVVSNVDATSASSLEADEKGTTARSTVHERNNSQSADTASCNVIFAARQPEIMAWYKAELAKLAEQYPAASFHARIFLTSGSYSDVNAECKLRDKEAEASDGNSSDVSSMDTNKEYLSQDKGRPVLADVISQAVAAPASAGKTVGVAVCGPVGMIYDVRNACAAAQTAKGAADVYLHAEVFGW